jgi:hypothetical protein
MGWYAELHERVCNLCHKQVEELSGTLTVQEASRALEARIGRIQQPMEQSGRIGVGRRIARTLEDSREKRQNVEEGRGTKQNELSKLNAKLTKSRGRWKKGKTYLKKVEDSREKRGKVDEGREMKRNEQI